MSAATQEALRARLRAHGAAGFLTLDPDQQHWLTGFRATAASPPTMLLIGTARSMLIVPERDRRNASEHAHVDCVKAYDERLDGSMPGSCDRLLDALLDVLAERAPLAVDEQRLPLVVADRMRAHGHEPLAFGAVVRGLVDMTPELASGARGA